MVDFVVHNIINGYFMIVNKNKPVFYLFPTELHVKLHTILYKQNIGQISWFNDNNNDCE